METYPMPPPFMLVLIVIGTASVSAVLAIATRDRLPSEARKVVRACVLVEKRIQRMVETIWSHEEQLIVECLTEGQLIPDVLSTAKRLLRILEEVEKVVMEPPKHPVDWTHVELGNVFRLAKGGGNFTVISTISSTTKQVSYTSIEMGPTDPFEPWRDWAEQEYTRYEDVPATERVITVEPRACREGP